jgi:hypothetical protein
MLVLLMHTRTAWNDYFTGSPTLYQSNQYGARQTPSDTYVHVSNCLFRSIASTNGHGGAISCTSVAYLLVESSSFFSCSTSYCYGGAIYFSNSNGQCVLHEVCGYDCYSTHTSYPYGQFLSTNVNNAASSKNYVNYSSIVRCVNERSGSRFTLYLYYGKIICPSINMSMNKCLHYTVVFFIPFVDSNSVTCLFSHSSLTDNIATQYICFHIWSGGANCEMKSCNILRNTQGSLNSEGIFYTYDKLVIKDSCILENKANRIFQQYNYPITLSNCTVDSTTNNGYLTLQSTVTKILFSD